MSVLLYCVFVLSGIFLGGVALGVGGLGRGRGRWLSSTRLAPLAAAASVAVIAGVLWTARFDRVLLSAGVYRSRVLPSPGADSVIFYRDGRTATVAVTRDLTTGATVIRTNGKPDGSIPLDWLIRRDGAARRVIGGEEANLVLAGVIPLAYRPDGRRGAVIGQGTGMTSHVMLASPTLEELVTIDIEPEMIEGSRYFYPANRRVFEDPRSRFVVDDAKSYFASRGVRYDMILSQPSHPWVSGVSGLFTSELYARARTHLADDGIFAQWLHLYDISDQLVLSVIAALHANFPSYVIHQISDHDLIIVAGKRPTLPRPDWSVLDLPELRKDFGHLRPITGEAMDGAYLAGRADLAPVLDGAIVPNSDFHPVLDLGSEQSRYLGVRAVGFANLHGERFDLMDALSGRRRVFGTELLGAIGGVPRLRGLAFGARLRASRAGISLDSIATTPAFRAALFRQRSLQQFYSARLAPGDWPSFIRLALEAERDLHLGSSGVTDETFYAPLFEYLRTRRAPPDAVAAVSFTHALAGWDFERARTAGDTVSRALVSGTSWVDADMLREGLVVASLRTGNVAAARRAFDDLRRYSTRPAQSLRALLLEAYLTSAESAGSVASGGGTSHRAASAAR